MSKTSHFVEFGWVIPLFVWVCLTSSVANHSAFAQAATEQPIVVRGEEVPSAYGAPPAFSRSRFSNTTQAYVLPPWAFFFGEIYEGQGFRHGPPDHIFTQEIEMGLPYRFGVAAEATFERFNGGGGAETVSLEARWALAEWNKIPLIQHSSRNTNSVSALFDTKKDRHRLLERKKRKRADRPKFQMPTNFVCSSPRISASTLSGP